MKRLRGPTSTARRVCLNLKAFGAADALDDNFRRLGMLSQVTDWVIVTGMGKSGHIARKIAATLASTGSPALCPSGEASHEILA